MLKKITRVEVNNYQSHKHTVLDTDSPVVVLSGESNNGKTVIIRALQWLVTNRPMGDGFVSHWQMHQTKSGKVALNADTLCSVSVDAVDMDGTVHNVKRVKTASENYYEVDGTKLSAIGAGVPKEVTDLLAFNDENIQDQDEKYYLLTLTGSQVSSKLNELVNLDCIDDAYAIIKRQKLDESAKHKAYESQYYEHKVAVDGLKHVPELVEELDEAKDLYVHMADIGHDLDNINDLICRLRSVDSRLEDLSMLSSYEQSIARVTALLDEYGSGLEALHAMKEAMRQYDRVEVRLGDLPEVNEKMIERLVKCTDALEKTDAEFLRMHKDLRKWKALDDSIHPLPEEAFAEWEALASEYEALSAKVKGLSDMCEDARALELMIKRNDEMLESYRAELPDICPLCGQPMEGHMHV